MKHVEIFTDGACQGNPGKGGWGVLLRCGNAVKELSGYEEVTTNNRMELTAVIQGLLSLKEPCKVTLTTDSQYVVNGITQGWAENWQKNGWRNTKRQPVANIDLWEELLSMLQIHDVKFIWVKGHAGYPENERCDQLAVAEYMKNS